MYQGLYTVIFILFVAVMTELIVAIKQNAEYDRLNKDFRKFLKIHSKSVNELLQIEDLVKKTPHGSYKDLLEMKNKIIELIKADNDN